MINYEQYRQVQLSRGSGVDITWNTTYVGS
jgi:hypothetical protein